MKKTVIISVAMLLFLAGLASASYITIYSKYYGTTVAAEDSLTIDFSSTPHQLNDNLYVETTFSASGSTQVYDIYFDFGTDVIKIHVQKASSSSEDRTIRIFKNGVKIVDTDYLEQYPDSARVFMINSTHATIQVLEGSTIRAEANTTLSGEFKQMRYEVTYGSLKVKYVYIKRYSNLLTGLNVYDENTNSAISSFDFSEGSDYVRVFDPSSYYIARTYYATGDLNAYLVKYSEGHYYTIQTSANYANKILQALRNIDGAWTLVGETKLDSEGTSSMFLADGVTYKFRIVDGGSTLLEAEKTASPSELTIYLASELSSISTVVDPTNQFSWRIDPIDGFLYYNMTNNVTVKFSSEELTVSNITLTLSGAGVSKSITQLFNSKSGEFTTNVTPSQNNAYLYATIDVAFSDNSTSHYSKSFYVKSYYQDTNATLFGTIETVPQELGLSTLGMTIIAGIVALIAASGATRVAGDRAGVFAAMITMLFFSYVKWLDRRIAMLSLLAGLGFMIRRGET